MNATKTENNVRFYFAGEHTTTWSKATGLCPNRTCGHKHRSQEAAEKCAAELYPQVVYAETSDGRTVTADQAWRETV